MNVIEIPATLGSRSSPSIAFFLGVQAFYLTARAIGQCAEGEYSWAIGSGIAAVLSAMCAFWTLRDWNQARTRLLWGNDEIQVIHEDQILFSGPLCLIDSITADGRGYFLHINNKPIVRLRRRDVPCQLALAMEEHIGSHDNHR